MLNMLYVLHMDMFFLSVRKLKNQASNKLLLALFFIQTVKQGNIREESHINLLFLRVGPVPRDSILFL